MDPLNVSSFMLWIGGLFTAIKLKFLAWGMLLFGTVGANSEIDFYTRIANLEIAVFGGPNVAGVLAPTLTGTADAMNFPGRYWIKSTSADAITLAAPVAGTDDLKMLRVVSTTAFAHTITTPANTIVNGSSAAGDTLTFAAHVGASVTLIAFGGLWYILEVNNVTLSEV